MVLNDIGRAEVLAEATTHPEPCLHSLKLRAMVCVQHLFLPLLTAGKIFLFPLITITFQPNESQKSVPLKVLNNHTIGSTEEFTAILSVNTNYENQVKITQNSATIAVINDATGKSILFEPQPYQPYTRYTVQQ